MYKDIQQYLIVCSRIFSLARAILDQRYPSIPFSMQGKRGDFWVNPPQGYSAYLGPTFRSHWLDRTVSIYYSREGDGLSPWTVSLTTKEFNFKLYLHEKGFYVATDFDGRSPRDTATIALPALQAMAEYISKLVADETPAAEVKLVNIWQLLPAPLAQEAVNQITHSGHSIEEILASLTELCGEGRVFYNPDASPPAITAHRGNASSILSYIPSTGNG